MTFEGESGFSLNITGSLQSGDSGPVTWLSNNNLQRGLRCSARHTSNGQSRGCTFRENEADANGFYAWGYHYFWQLSSEESEDLFQYLDGHIHA